ncbi:hypothetical protein D3C71_2161450 [compost metagenome]
MAQGARLACEWAGNPQRLALGRAQALQFAQAHRGAAERTAHALADVLAATRTRE